DADPCTTGNTYQKYNTSRVKIRSLRYLYSAGTPPRVLLRTWVWGNKSRQQHLSIPTSSQARRPSIGRTVSVAVQRPVRRCRDERLSSPNPRTVKVEPLASQLKE